MIRLLCKHRIQHRIEVRDVVKLSRQATELAARSKGAVSDKCISHVGAAGHVVAVAHYQVRVVGDYCTTMNQIMYIRFTYHRELHWAQFLNRADSFIVNGRLIS